MSHVFVYYNPNPQWEEASRACHPVEMDESFPAAMTSGRFQEILAWAKRLPGWSDDVLVAKPAKEAMLEQARAMYSTGRFSKTQVAAKFPLHRDTILKVLRDVDSNAA